MAASELPVAGTETTEASPKQYYQILSATYQSPNNDNFTHTTKLSTPPSKKPAHRTAYLADLRKAIVVMQEQINKELTSRMEDDKACEAGGVRGASTGVVDEAKEEDNYGEEVVEEE